jgi:hypothetical protein
VGRGAPHREPVIRSGCSGRECHIGTGSLVCVNAERVSSMVSLAWGFGGEDDLERAGVAGALEGVVVDRRGVFGQVGL